MRAGAFLLGGIVGAAAVVYWQKNKQMLGFSSVTNASDSMNKWMNKGSNSASKQFSSSFKNNNVNKQQDNFSSGHDGSVFSKVQEIINADSDVKQQVDDILSSNNQSSASQQH